MTTRMDDASLVRSALAGDQRAFAELARRYRDAAFGIAFHRLGDFEAARDATQEALVTAFLDLPTLRDPSKFGNWLYRITATKAAAFVRRQRITISLDAPGIAETICSESPSVEQGETARLVRDALSALSDNERLAVILHYVNGYSHAEIGDLLGTSVPAVKSRIHRGRGRLREEMRDMVEETLRKSTLERFDLKPLEFWAFYGYCLPVYGDIVDIKVTSVFGRSNTVAAGEDYVVRGEYMSKAAEEITLDLVVGGTSTGHTSPLQPGSGRFELYCHVDKMDSGTGDSLAILLPDEKSWVMIKLGRTFGLRPLRYSLRDGFGDQACHNTLEVEVRDVLGASLVVSPGAVFVVRGRYRLPEPIVTSLCVDADGTTSGFQSPLPPGEHAFETMGEVRAVNPGKEQVLYLHMFAGDEDLGSHTNIILEK